MGGGVATEPKREGNRASYIERFSFYYREKWINLTMVAFIISLKAIQAAISEIYSDHSLDCNLQDLLKYSFESI